MMREDRGRAVTKADVAAAKATLLQRNEYPSTPKVRKELANTIQHSGNQNQVSKWLQELRDEEMAAVKHDDAPPMPSEPLPQEVQEVLDGGHATIGSAFATLASRLAVSFTTTKMEVRKCADEYIATAMAEAVRRADEIEIEAADRGVEIERLDKEIERLHVLLEQQAAEILPLKESLAVARDNISSMEAERDIARKDSAATQVKIEEIYGELASVRQNTAVVTTQRDQAVKRSVELQAQLEATTEKNGALAAELSDVKANRAELAGQNMQLVSERDNLRETARAERERAEQALDEVRIVKAEVAKLTVRKAANEKKKGNCTVPTV